MEDIMVVDDDQGNLDLVRRILECAGLKAYCVASGEEALRELYEKTFLLMITDLNMPGMNGFELSRKAREIAPDMAIIMNTGEYSSKISQLAMEAGILRIIAKPFHPDKMLEIVKDILEMESWNGRIS